MTADEFNSFRTPQSKQLEMWQKWKESNEDPQHLRPLQNSFNGLLNQHVNKYKNLESVPKPLLQAKADELFLKSLRTYNPNKGALSTHVTYSVKQIDRFVKTYQNAGRVQETRAGNFGEYLASKSNLLSELGRDPTAEELSSHMTLTMGKPITPREAQRYMKEDRKDISEGSWGDDSLSRIPSANALILRLVHKQLMPEQQAVFERLYGLNGARRMRPSEIAKDLRVHPSKVSRIRGQIESILKSNGVQVTAG